MLTRLLSICALTMLAGPALAWEVHVEGPDVFGTTKVSASEHSGYQRLVVHCDSKDVLIVAIIARKKEFDETPSGDGKLLIQVDAATPVTLNAVRRSWNDNFGGVVAEGRTLELLAIVKAIQGGKARINTGIEIDGIQSSATFSASGSTAAMAKAIDGCGLTSIGAD